MLFRRKRRVLCTRGFLSDQATGLVLHTGPNGGQQGASRSGLLLGAKNRRRVLPGSGPVSLLWGLLEFFRFFLVLRPEEVFLPQVIRLLLGDVPSPLVGVDRAIQFICQAI